MEVQRLRWCWCWTLKQWILYLSNCYRHLVTAVILWWYLMLKLERFPQIKPLYIKNINVISSPFQVNVHHFSIYYIISQVWTWFKFSRSSIYDWRQWCVVCRTASCQALFAVSGAPAHTLWCCPHRSQHRSQKTPSLPSKHTQHINRKVRSGQFNLYRPVTQNLTQRTLQSVQHTTHSVLKTWLRERQTPHINILIGEKMEETSGRARVEESLSQDKHTINVMCTETNKITV